MGLLSKLWVKSQKEQEPVKMPVWNAIGVEPTKDEYVYMNWYIEEYIRLSIWEDGSHGYRDNDLCWRVDIVDGVRWLLLVDFFTKHEIKRFTYPKNSEKDFWRASFP